MKQILLLIAVVALVGCGTTKVDPNATTTISDPIVEEAVRETLRKDEGELTKADLAEVTYLILSFSYITDAGLKEVAKLQKLTQLYLMNTKITDACLPNLAKLQKLKYLFLSNTKITDAGLKEVAKLQNLTTLHLDKTQITDEGAAWLKKALPKCLIYR